MEKIIKPSVKDVHFTLKKGNGVNSENKIRLMYIFDIIFAGFFVFVLITILNDDLSFEYSLLAVGTAAFMFVAPICATVYVRKRSRMLSGHIRDCLVDAIPVVAEVELIADGLGYGNFLRVTFETDGKKKCMISPGEGQTKDFKLYTDVRRYTGEEILCYYSPRQNDILFTAQSRVSDELVLSGEAAYVLNKVRMDTSCFDDEDEDDEENYDDDADCGDCWD